MNLKQLPNGMCEGFALLKKCDVKKSFIKCFVYDNGRFLLPLGIVMDKKIQEINYYTNRE